MQTPPQDTGTSPRKGRTGRKGAQAQPSNGVTPQVLVKEQILPSALLSTVVLPSYFRRGVAELQLPVDVDALWQQAWLVVSNGI